MSPRVRTRKHGPGVEDATSGAPGGGVPARHVGAFYEVPDYEVAPFGAPLPHVCEGRKKDGGPHAEQKMGTMNHVCTNVRA